MTVIALSLSLSSANATLQVNRRLGTTLVFRTDFEDVTKKDANHLNMGIDHEFDLKSDGAAMWVEGLDRQTTSITCHSGSRCIGMEMTNIVQSVRNEFNILHLQNLVKKELFVSVWLYLPPDWTLHNFASPSHNWNQIINPFFTDGPTYLPYASFNMIQPDPSQSFFGVRLDYRDINGNSITLQNTPNYPIPRGSWFNVQYYVYRSVANGTIEVWINGVLIFNAANVSTKNPSITSWFSTPAKIYYDPRDTFSPYRVWVDDLEISV